MDIFGLIIGLTGSIILATGAINVTAVADARLSLTKFGANLDVAKALGRQRASTLVGIIIYTLGILIGFVGLMFPPDRSWFNILGGLFISIFLLRWHFAVIVPRESRRSMLASLKMLYTQNSAGRQSWEQDNAVPGWRERLLKDLGLRKDMTKEELEQIIWR